MMVGGRVVKVGPLIKKNFLKLEKKSEKKDDH